MCMNISNIKHFISLCNTRIATDLNLATFKAPLLATSFKQSANIVRPNVLSKFWHVYVSTRQDKTICVREGKKGFLKASRREIALQLLHMSKRFR